MRLYWTAVALLAAVGLPQTPATTRKGDVKRDHCNKTVDIYEDVASPEVTPENAGQPLTCWYRFRSFRGTPRDWVLRIRFKKFKVGVLVNATHCQHGYLQIVDGNAKTDVSNRRDPGVFCGETEQPQTFISETSFVKVLFHADNFTDQTYFSFDSRAEQQFEVYLRYGQHPELYPNRRGEVVPGSYCERAFRDCRLQTCYVQSAAYPGVYPRGLRCRYHLATRLPFIKLYIENEEFNVDGQRCENIMTCPMRPISSDCPYDYIKIYDGKTEDDPLIGTFCGMGKFPYSLIGTGTELFVEFVSSPAGPLLNTGFHFNVGSWPGRVDGAGTRTGACDWLLSSDALHATGEAEGIFLSVAHWYPPHTTCSYLLQGRPGEVVRIYFPSFRVNRIESPIAPIESDCGESLTLYDAAVPDDARIIKTFCDTFSRPMEKHDFVSSAGALLVRFESKTGSYSGSSLYYWAHYDFFNNTRFGEPVAGTVCDEDFPSWRQASGWLRSPLNTLAFKGGVRDVRCLYRFLSAKHIYARVILTVESLGFKENPYLSGQTLNCWDDRVDKLVIWEPSGANGSAGGAVGGPGVACLWLRSLPLTITSRGPALHMQLRVDAAHAAQAYFKEPGPLFEARYEFLHGPICGEPQLAAATEGFLLFPDLRALLPQPPKRARCIWELRVHPERDLWLHMDKMRLATHACEDGRLELFLPGRTEPHVSVCGDNMTLLRDLPVLSAKELAGEQPGLTVHFTGAFVPGRVAFKISWTELFHLPRQVESPQGGAAEAVETGRLLGDPDCYFLCPGEGAWCVPARLVCNGVASCPNASADEAPALCRREEAPPLDWALVGAGVAAGVVLLVVLGVACLCRSCCRKRRRY